MPDEKSNTLLKAVLAILAEDESGHASMMVAAEEFGNLELQHTELKSRHESLTSQLQGILNGDGPLRCPFCRGRGGHDSAEDSHECGWCKGVGQLTLKGIHDETMGFLAQLREIRPKADAYSRVLQALGIEDDILGFVQKLRDEIKLQRVTHGAALDQARDTREELEIIRDCLHTVRSDRDDYRHAVEDIVALFKLTQWSVRDVGSQVFRKFLEERSKTKPAVIESAK